MDNHISAPPATGVEAANLRVRELHRDDYARWESFVESHPGATFFHRAGWKDVIEQAFGHRCYFLYAESDAGIRGVLPLGHIRSRMFGNALISTPFCVYGGAIAHDGATLAVLENAACELAQQLDVDYLELRNRRRSRQDRLTKDLYVTFRKPIDSDSERNMAAIPRKQRAMIRKGIKANLTSVIDEDLDRFYEMYATSVRNLGTPVFSRTYFHTMKQVFGEDCEVLTVNHEQRPIASVMSFYFRDEVLPYYGGGAREARQVAGNDFMYWELMRRACDRGIRVFDYGRSKVGTGSYHFKKNWGFEPEPLYYEYFLVNAKEMPQVNPLNAKYRLFINMWKHLPVTLTKAVGPLISRNLG